MNLKVNRKIVSKEPNERVIRETMAGLPPGKGVAVELRRGRGDVLYAQGRPSTGYRLTWQDPLGNTQFSRRSDVDGDTAVLTLTLYAQSDPDWQGLADWLPPNVYRYHSTNPVLNALGSMPPGLGALLIFGTAFFFFAVYALLTNAPGVGLQEVLLGFVAIGMLAAYIQYIEFFFSAIRPWLARWMGALLGVQINEDQSDARWFGGAGAGTWDAKGGSAINRLLLHIIDIVVLVVGLIGPVAVVSIGAFLIFDR
ncbi:MAG TPA: hypothetical protein PLD25_24060 [Chloroflexota bacterium]|nr:hypothetical protein [Chloroflexota bacterium]